MKSQLICDKLTQVLIIMGSDERLRFCGPTTHTTLVTSTVFMYGIY